MNLPELKGQYIWGTEELGIDDAKFVEAISRSLCELRDLPPDESVPQQNNDSDAMWFCPQWMNVADEVIARLEFDTAHQMALELMAQRLEALRAGQ